MARQHPHLRDRRRIRTDLVRLLLPDEHAPLPSPRGRGAAPYAPTPRRPADLTAPSTTTPAPSLFPRRRGAVSRADRRSDERTVRCGDPNGGLRGRAAGLRSQEARASATRRSWRRGVTNAFPWCV